jgi:DNA-binding PadR family transcriptional regulator
MKNASALEFALLGLIAQEPRSGYDLRKIFATTAMRHYSDSPGSIYPALRRLEKRDWIVAVANRAEVSGRGRTAFRLTAAGRSSLKEWLSLPVSFEDVAMRPEELMLRFAIMDGNAPRQTAIRLLQALEDGLAAQVMTYRLQLREMQAMLRKPEGTVAQHTGVLAFEAGIEGMESRLAWARRARAKLMEESKPKLK